MTLCIISRGKQIAWQNENTGVALYIISTSEKPIL